jgi:hypothetical protein
MDTAEVNTAEEECEQFGEGLDAGASKCTVHEKEHVEGYQECENLTEETLKEEKKTREKSDE